MNSVDFMNLSNQFVVYISLIHYLSLLINSSGIFLAELGKAM